jgi:hypothetical protein
MRKNDELSAAWYSGDERTLPRCTIKFKPMGRDGDLGKL